MPRGAGWARRRISPMSRKEFLEPPGFGVAAEAGGVREPKASVGTTVPGPRSTALRRQELEHLAPGAQHYAVLSGIVVAGAEGSVITDADGNRFLDIIG